MTSKPQSSISYVSDRFLKKALNQLVGDGIITFWFYIKHKPDIDDKMPHIHLRFELRKSIDIESYRQKYFIQYKKKNVTEKTLMFRQSKCEDAILYFLHNEKYLKYKNMHRNITYSYSDLVTNDKDELKYRYHIALEYLDSVLLRDYECEEQIKGGVTLSSLANDGLITSKNAWKMKNYCDIIRKHTINIEYQKCIDLQSELNQALDIVHARQDELKQAIIQQDKLNSDVQLLKRQLEFNLNNPFIK